MNADEQDAAPVLVEDPPSTKTIADNEPDSSVKDEKNASHDVAETSTIELQVGEKPVASQNKDEVDDDNSKDREEVKETEPFEEKDKMKSQQTVKAASPDSTNTKEKSNGKRTPSFTAILTEAKEIIGSKTLGRTRSQDRKRSLKRSNSSLTSTPARPKPVAPASKRKRH